MAIITVMFGPRVRCARSAPARGTGRFAPTSTHSPSRRSWAMTPAIVSFAVAGSDRVGCRDMRIRLKLVEAEDAAKADNVEVFGVILRSKDVAAKVVVKRGARAALQPVRGSHDVLAQVLLVWPVEPLSREGVRPESRTYDPLHAVDRCGEWIRAGRLGRNHAFNGDEAALRRRGDRDVAIARSVMAHIPVDVAESCVQQAHVDLDRRYRQQQLIVNRITKQLQPWVHLR